MVTVVLVETNKMGKELVPHIQAEITKREKQGFRLVSTELHGSNGMWLFFDK